MKTATSGAVIGQAPPSAIRGTPPGALHEEAQSELWAPDPG